MECASEAVCQRRDKEICYLGWILLFSWLVMVIYITKEIWFGAPLSTPSPSLNSIVETEKTEKRKRRRRKVSDDDVIELDFIGN
ncbi:unnamed protein product [Caenorhabditis brenneri]